jgi:predicted nuclease with TOPRIM domain
LQRSSVAEKLSIIPNGVSTNSSNYVRKGGDSNEEFENLAKKLQETQKEKEELMKELQRLKDQKDIPKLQGDGMN